jgi:hypothetical protein
MARYIVSTSVYRVKRRNPLVTLIQFILIMAILAWLDSLIKPKPKFEPAPAPTQERQIQL